jgi:hypothetical protein
MSKRGHNVKCWRSSCVSTRDMPCSKQDIHVTWRALSHTLFPIHAQQVMLETALRHSPGNILLKYTLEIYPGNISWILLYSENIPRKYTQVGKYVIYIDPYYVISTATK